MGLTTDSDDAGSDSAQYFLNESQVLKLIETLKHQTKSPSPALFKHKDRLTSALIEVGELCTGGPEGLVHQVLAEAPGKLANQKIADKYHNDGTCPYKKGQLLPKSLQSVSQPVPTSLTREPRKPIPANSILF